MSQRTTTYRAVQAVGPGKLAMLPTRSWMPLSRSGQGAISDIPRV
jgi:hypothetical protein